MFSFFGRSKPVAVDDAPTVREEEGVEVEDRGSSHEALVVSPESAPDLTADLPDRSAEDAASIVNDLAFNNVSKSPPKPAALGKRKRQKTDVVGASPKKRVAKAGGTDGASDEPPIPSSNGIAGLEGSANRASSEVAKEAPGKLSRPSKKQQIRHMAQIYPAVQPALDIWDAAPGLEEQVEKPDAPPTAPARKPPSSEATSRPRGRPRKGPSSSKNTTSIQEGDRGETRRRPEGDLSPAAGSREGLPQKAGSKAQREVSTAKSGDESRERARHSRSTRSTAATNGNANAILNTDIDYTKKPERDARKAAKLRKTREHASVSTPPSAQTNSPDKAKTRETTQRAPQKESTGRASAQQASNRTQIDVANDLEHSDGEAGEGRGTEVDQANGVEAAVASNEQNSGEINDVEGEREEDESDSDGSSQADDSEAHEAAEYQYELFGQEPAWRTILEGASSICGRKLLHNHMPKLMTDTIKDLVNEVREARSLYEQLPNSGEADDDILDDLNDQLSERLDKIEVQIRRLSEQTAATKSSQMIKDIYARAIPAMVFLLQSALAARVYHSDEPCNLKTLNGVVSGLKEIIHLQDMTALLCMKARYWKASPVPTSRPIKKPTSQKIYPHIKFMQQAFTKKFSEQQRKRKMKQNEADSRKREHELALSSQRSKQEAARRNEILLTRMKASREEEDEKRRNLHRTFKQCKEDDLRARMQHQQLPLHPAPPPLWSDAEDIALYFQLEKGYAGNLTSEERYLKILNAPLLQNKLPQHIQERALYFKPTLLEQWGALEWIASIR